MLLFSHYNVATSSCTVSMKVAVYDIIFTSYSCLYFLNLSSFVVAMDCKDKNNQEVLWKYEIWYEIGSTEAQSLMQS